MKKQSIAILTAGLLVLSVQNVFASGHIPLAEGNLWSSQPKAKISLQSLEPFAIYNAVCTITDPSADEYPVFVRFSANAFRMDGISFDGVFLASQQQKINDRADHTVIFNKLQCNGFGCELELSRLYGEGTASPVHYKCHAEVVVGSKK
jgi:hypothetical protein